MKSLQTHSPAWRLAACVATLLAANAQAASGPINIPNSTLSTNPYAIAPIQSGPLNTLGAEPARNVYLPSGVVVDVHGRELTAVRATNPDPMNAGAADRPGFVSMAEASAERPGTIGGSPAQGADGSSEPSGLTPMPAPALVVPDVPEPSSYALMGAGLAVLVWAARRRAQRRG
jgi:hypothetical protein